MGEKHSQGNILTPPLDSSIKLAIECKYGDTIRAGNVFLSSPDSDAAAAQVQCMFNVHLPIVL